MKAAAFLLMLFAGLALHPARADAGTVVSDLSQHQISITSSFRGADLLLFGAIQYGQGDPEPATPDDIVVAVRGPAADTEVRRKSRIAGIWINRDSAVFADVPGYYAVLSTRPLGDIAGPQMLDRHRLGASHLQLQLLSKPPSEGVGPYLAALSRIQQSHGLFQLGEGAISRIGSSLFRADVHFPASVPEGSYTAEIYLIRDGVVIYAQTVPLFVDKAGFERNIYRLAQNHAELYGLGAVLLALVLGWAGARLFQR